MLSLAQFDPNLLCGWAANNYIIILYIIFIQQASCVTYWQSTAAHGKPKQDHRYYMARHFVLVILCQVQVIILHSFAFLNPRCGVSIKIRCPQILILLIMALSRISSQLESTTKDY